MTFSLLSSRNKRNKDFGFSSSPAEQKKSKQLIIHFMSPVSLIRKSDINIPVFDTSGFFSFFLRCISEMISTLDSRAWKCCSLKKKETNTHTHSPRVRKCYLTHIWILGRTHISHKPAEWRTLALAAAAATASPAVDPNDSDKHGAPPTFAVSVGPSEDRALLDDSVGLEEAVHVLLGLLFVQHPHEQLPVFWKQKKRKKKQDRGLGGR